MLVSFAGPAANFLLSIGFAVLLRLLIEFFPCFVEIGIEGEENEADVARLNAVVAEAGTRPEDGSEIKNTVKTKTQSYIRLSQMQSCVQTGRN